MEKIAVFAGAGISKAKPSNLPSWWDYNKYVLDAIQQEASKAFKSDKPFYSSEKMLETLPVTSISDVIFTCGLGEIYFNMVSCLEGTRPNINHFILANMAKMGYLSCVITTNFDTLIERAFDELNVPYIVLIEEEDYTLNDKEEKCLIVKLHGSVNSTASLIDTVTQKMKGLTERKKELLRTILREYSAYVIGMSGEDLRFDLDYFQFLSSNTKNKITWVKHPKGSLSPMVSRLENRIDLVIVEEEIPTLFNAYTPELANPSVFVAEDEKQTEISKEINKCVCSIQVGPFVCMGIVLQLLYDIGDTVQVTHICKDIIYELNKEPEQLYQPFKLQITPLLHNMSVVMINTGNIELAMQIIKKCISIHEYNYLQMRNIYYTNKEVLKKTSISKFFSIEKFEAEFHKNKGNAYINLGVCFFKRRKDGDLDKAGEYFQKALDEFLEAKDERGINLAKSSISEINFNKTSFYVFHNSEEEYNYQVNEYDKAMSHAQSQGDFETYVTVSCLLAKLFMEYGEYGSAEKVISFLESYMEINISTASIVRYHELKAELYIRHNMEDECQNEIEEAFKLIDKGGVDIYIKRNLCLREVMLLGHSHKCLDYTKRCLEFLRDNQDVQTIDRYYEKIPIDKAISLAEEKKTLFSIPSFFMLGQDYLKEKSKVIRAAIIRATFCNDKEMVVLLFEKLVSECMHKLDPGDVCRICFAYVQASKKIMGGSYKYEATYTLIICLMLSGLDPDGSISLQYIDDVLKYDDSDNYEYNEIVGRLYASKSQRLLFREEYFESEKSFIVAREKLSKYDDVWQREVNDRVYALIDLKRQDLVMDTLKLSFPNKSDDEIEVIYNMIENIKR